MIHKIPCLSCGTNLEFEDHLIGNTVPCPNCSAEMILAIKKIDSPKPQPTSTSKTVNYLTTVKTPRDLTEKLEFFGNGFLVAAGAYILISVFAIMAAMTQENADYEVVGVIIISALGALGTAFFFRTLLYSVAEIIRVLRRIAVATEKK